MWKSSNKLWSDAELADAVDAYVFLLQAQARGLKFRGETAAMALLHEGLPERNDASLRYRFRNISAVIKDLGIQPLQGSSAAEKVGTGVRARILDLLRANDSFNELAARSHIAAVSLSAKSDNSTVKADALAALDRLRQEIDDVEREAIGLGHNNPPEPLSASADRRAAFEEARSEIASLKSELEKARADRKVVALSSERLLQFGVKMTAWVGQRTTKFADATLTALAPAMVVKVTGLLPLIVDAIDAVARAIAQ